MLAPLLQAAADVAAVASVDGDPAAVALIDVDSSCLSCACGAVRKYHAVHGQPETWRVDCFYGELYATVASEGLAFLFYHSTRPILESRTTD